tara:strand:+ start:56 stop:1192 length:1137 start_codon:yes stop_codon:yes gene_type:complete
MPSTFTTNTGIEKPGNGEQSGSWGTTVNTNMDILDRTVNGVVSLTLTGTSSTITTANGATSDGQYRVLLLGGVLSATHTITVDPADAQKIYYVKNSTGQTVTFTQGSGAVTADVPNDGFGVVFADGSDECVNLTDSSSISSLVLGGTAVTTTGAELNVIDGNTSATSTTVTASDSIVFNDNGVMKQVSMADINTYIQSQVSSPTVNNSTITITAGDVLTGGGTFTTNGGATSITLNHQDVSSQGSVNGSGNTFIQDVTLDSYGHVTGLGTATAASGGGAPKAVYGGRTPGSLNITNVLNGDILVAWLADLATTNASEFIQIWDQSGWVGFNPSSTMLASATTVLRWENTTGSTKAVFVRGNISSTGGVGRILTFHYGS